MPDDGTTSNYGPADDAAHGLGEHPAVPLAVLAHTDRPCPCHQQTVVTGTRWAYSVALGWHDPDEHLELLRLIQAVNEPAGAR